MIGRSDHTYVIADVRVRVRTLEEPFRCHACGNEWTATYEIRDYTGPLGERWVVDCRDGVPVPPPQFGDRCPRCQRVSTDVHERADHRSSGPRSRTATA
jgi:hypothetical protein